MRSLILGFQKKKLNLIIYNLFETKLIFKNLRQNYFKLTYKGF